MNPTTCPAWFRWEGTDLILRLRVQPRASRDELAAPHGESFRVRITAPPVDGRANEHLMRFLASSFGVPRTAVILEAGETGREKRIRIRDPQHLPIPGIGAGRT